MNRNNRVRGVPGWVSCGILLLFTNRARISEPNPGAFKSVTQLSLVDQSQHSS